MESVFIERGSTARANWMITVGGDAVEVVDERVAELFHLAQTPPSQGFQPAEEKSRDTPRVL
jgi:hypothetical protein